MKNFCVVLLVFVSLSCFSQFEGKIVYQNSYEWKGADGLTTEQFTQYMGDRSEYYVKGSYYKTTSNGMYYSSQTYSPEENKLYNQIDAKDTLIWFNTSIGSDTIVSISIDESDEVVLGNNCKVLTIKTTEGKGLYYFSNNFRINPEPFIKHHYGNLSIITRETKAPILKFEIHN